MLDFCILLFQAFIDGAKVSEFMVCKVSQVFLRVLVDELVRPRVALNPKRNVEGVNPDDPPYQVSIRIQVVSDHESILEAVRHLKHDEEHSTKENHRMPESHIRSFFFGQHFTVLEDYSNLDFP